MLRTLPEDTGGASGGIVARGSSIPLDAKNGGPGNVN